MIINFVLFFIEVKKYKENKRVPKNVAYYTNLLLLVIYLFIFAFGIAIILSILYDRFIDKICYRKKMTLEEKLLSKKISEEDNEKSSNNIINNSNDKN